MTTVKCFAIGFLFDAVQARFDLDCTEVEMVFGWRRPAQYKKTDNRIVWTPGDEGGSLGQITPAISRAGEESLRRSLGTLNELVTVRIESLDPQFPEDERAQYRAARCLYDAWYRAVYLAVHGNFEILSSDWDNSKLERRHGLALIVIVSVGALLPDAPFTLAPVDTEGDITTELDDVSEKSLEPAP